MKKLLLCILLLSAVAFGQTADAKAQDRHGNSGCDGTAINPTNNVMPVRSSATSFADSPLSLDANGHLQIGVSPTPNSGNTGISLIGTGNPTTRAILEVHNNFANGAELFSHNDLGYLAPYMYFYKTRGTQASPSPVTFTGYELDSIGGISFGGWDGASYFSGSAAIYTQSDEDWTPATHGGHLSIYGTDVNGGHTRQIIQFGGRGPNGENNSNIISYRGISFGGAQSGNPALNYTSNPPTAHIQKADGSGDAALTASSMAVTTSHTPATAFEACATGQIAWDVNFIYVCVAPNTWRRSSLAAW